MNQKNSLGLNECFLDTKDPFELFNNWMKKAKKSEINHPNATSLATSDKDNNPSVRMVLLKDYSQNGFVFYTNLDSKKSSDVKSNPNASICFHWKSLLRQIRVTGQISKVSDKEADDYYNTRDYGSKIGAWASKQSSILKSIDELYKKIENYKKKYLDEKNVPRPNYWSGWNLNPYQVEFWLDGKNRIHQRLRYTKKENGNWNKSLLSP